MADRRECLRSRVALPLRYAPLTPEETEIVAQGKGSMLLTGGTSPVLTEWHTVTSDFVPSSQETVLLQYLQILDAKLNWIIEHLTEDKQMLPNQGETIDLGGGGACFSAPEPLTVGTMLRIQLGTPLSINLIAQVVRVDPRTCSHSDRSGFAVAVRFVEIEDEVRERIIQFIFGNERQALRRRKKNQVSGG